MKAMKLCHLLALMTVLASCSQVDPPAPYGPTPSKVQLAWQKLEFYAFVHFTTNTFTDLEWGLGNADPSVFNPVRLDADQWMEAIESAGMKGVVLTAKHHDGFCLWPSEYTEYSVKNSPWLNGQGDVMRAVSDAAREHGLKMGVYLSPWDRHDDRYGSPAYVDYYRNQIRELLTGYGPIFEFWKDGANGGTGYYGGTESQERRVDARTYYDWENTHTLLRELQPDIFIFGGCTDGRWCGNESGNIGETNWCRLNKDNYHLGVPYNMDGLRYGEEDGTHWMPAECDVSIRPGWFWHESENSKVKSPEELLDIYYSSIGRGANLILNIPPNKDGLFSEEDVSSLKGLGELLKKEFGNCLNDKIRKAEASNVRGGSRSYDAKKAIDRDQDSYWATDDGTLGAMLMFTFDNPTTVNRVMLCEPVTLGQRISKFHIEARSADGNWLQIADGTTIGKKRLLRFRDVEATAIRVAIDSAKACPLLSDIEFYKSER